MSLKIYLDLDVEPEERLSGSIHVLETLDQYRKSFIKIKVEGTFNMWEINS